MTPFQALTIHASGPLNVLVTDVRVGPPNRALGLPSEAAPYRAIWDTGATNSAVTAKVIGDLKLIATGKVTVKTANQEVERDQFLADVELPTGVCIQSVPVTEATIADCDVLIGMDIINLVDFSVTNCNGKTTMSFRVPSIREIDYVREHNEEVKLVGTSREDRRKAQLADRRAQRKGLKK